MPALLFAILVLIGCASAPPPAPECHADEFRGVGTGESESVALAEAQSALARQINSSVNVTIERAVSQRVSNGKEDLSSGYESKTVIESSLPNAHDARIASRSRTSVTVCMTKADAAKGFIERQRLVLDSLGLASNTTLSVEHPKQKNEAWRRTQILYGDFMRIQYLLDGWGVKSAYSADEVYSKAREGYQAYCQNMKLHWKSADGQCSKAVFTELSKKVNIEKAECANGLNLSFSCSEECKSTSMGLKCSFEPSLAIESCGGESYSRLSAKEFPTGSDRHNESVAREKLIKNLPQASFLEEWKTEIKKWEPQCVK